MKTLYIDCGMGAAGDMLTAALLELLDDADAAAFVHEFNHLGLPGVRMKAEPSVKCGIAGTHVRILVDGEEEGAEGEGARGEGAGARGEGGEGEGAEAGEQGTHVHRHQGIAGIEHIIRDHTNLPAHVADDALAVYKLIAQAESHVHGVPVTDIHFHEVGTMDAIADVVAVCLLMDRLRPERVVVSPVHVGSGCVQCAHGTLPVPAPATAYLLRGVPIYGGEVQGEVCTPTGAALLVHFATEFGDMPVMRAEAIGYGMGTKDFPRANCVRVLLGQTEGHAEGCPTDEVVELSCNLDDMTAEHIAFAADRLLAGGALDVYTVPIGMKKSRPGTMLCALARPEDVDALTRLLFKHTTTLGVRKAPMQRAVLERSEEVVQTPFGDVRRKCASGYGVTRAKYEYDDIARIAAEHNLSIAEVLSALE